MLYIFYLLQRVTKCTCSPTDAEVINTAIQTALQDIQQNNITGMYVGRSPPRGDE